MGGYLLLAQQALSGAKTAERVNEKGKKLNQPWWQRAIPTWASFTNPVAGYVTEKYYDKRLNRLTGLEDKARQTAGATALQKTATAVRNQVNAQLNTDIARVNQEWGGAGRYASGARMKTIQGLSDKTQGTIANAVASLALQNYQFERSMDEQRAWNQAQLDAANQTSRAGQVADIASLLASIYGQNPEYWNEKIGGIGEKTGMVKPRQLIEPTTPEMNMTESDISIGSWLAPSTSAPPTADVPTNLTEPYIPALQPRVNLSTSKAPSIIPSVNTRPAPEMEKIDYDMFLQRAKENPQAVLDEIDNEQFMPMTEYLLDNSMMLDTSQDWSELYMKLQQPGANIPAIIAEYINDLEGGE